MKKKTVKRASMTKKATLQEPTTIDPNSINTSIMRILDWYREQNFSVDIQKNWLMEAALKLELSDAEAILRTPETYVIDSNAYVARMFCNDVNLMSHNIIFLTDKLNFYIAKGKSVISEVKERIAPIQKVKEAVEEISDSIIYNLDNNENFDIIEYITKNCLGVNYVKQLIKTLDEEKHKDTIVSLNEWVESNKKERKPRKKKVKSDEDICKLFIACEEDSGLKSINPVKILGSSCVVCYHVDKKKLQVYVGKKLGVHRSMIVNFDPKKSFECDLIDKKHLTELSLGGKLNVNKVINEYLEKDKGEVTGRVTKKILVITNY